MYARQAGDNNSHTSMTGGRFLSNDPLSFNVELFKTIMRGQAALAMVARVGVAIVSPQMKSSDMRMNQDFARWVIDFDQRISIEQAHLIAALAASVMADVDALVGKTQGTVSLSCSSTLCSVETDFINLSMDLRPALPTDVQRKMNVRHTRPKLHIVSSSLIPRQCYHILNYELLNRLLHSPHPLAEQLRTDLMNAAREKCQDPEAFDETEFVDMVLEYCGIDVVSGLRLEPNAKASQVKSKKASETDGQKEWLYEWTPSTYVLTAVYEYDGTIIREKHIDNVCCQHPTWGAAPDHDVRRSVALTTPQVTVLHEREHEELVQTLPTVEQIENMVAMKSEPLNTKKRKKKRLSVAAMKNSRGNYLNKGFIDSESCLRPLRDDLVAWYTETVLPKGIGISKTATVFGNIRVDVAKTNDKNLLSAIINVKACRYCPIKQSEHTSQHQYVEVSVTWKSKWVGEARLYCHDSECQADRRKKSRASKDETAEQKTARLETLKEWTPYTVLSNEAVVVLMEFCGIPRQFVPPSEQMLLHDRLHNTVFENKSQRREAMLSLAMANVLASQKRVEGSNCFIFFSSNKKVEA